MSKSSPRGQGPSPAPRRSHKPPSPGCTANQHSPAANRRAAAILEVLGGVRTPSEAAAALNISVTHYYLLERKALRGLVVACEMPPKGTRVPGVEQQLAALQRQLQKCHAQCLRQTALVRATQRAIGLAPIPPVDVGKGKGTAHGNRKRRQRPTVRALRAAGTLQKNSSGLDLSGELEQSFTQVATEPLSRSGPPEVRGDGQG